MRTNQPYSDRTIPARGGHHRDVDGMLEDFFKAEVPDPWPACPKVREVSVRNETPAGSRWFAESKKLLAIALGIGALLLGYSFLARNFPDSNMRPNGLKSEGTIGSKPGAPNIHVDPDPSNGVDGEQSSHHDKSPTTIPTKNGGVRLWEHQQDNKIFMRLEALPKP